MRGSNLGDRCRSALAILLVMEFALAAATDWSYLPVRIPAAGPHLTGAPRRDRRHRGAGHRDCLAVSLDGLLVLADQVGMIMAVFVPISGYKCSKNCRDGRI